MIAHGLIESYVNWILYQDPPLPDPPSLARWVWHDDFGHDPGWPHKPCHCERKGWSLA